MTRFIQENTAHPRQAFEPRILSDPGNVVRFPDKRIPLRARCADHSSRRTEIERELARLRVAALLGCEGLAASARQALASVNPDIVRQVAERKTAPLLPGRLRALIAFVDACVESPRSIRAMHLAALRDAGFDVKAAASLTRVIAAAIYETSFGRS